MPSKSSLSMVWVPRQDVGNDTAPTATPGEPGPAVSIGVIIPVGIIIGVLILVAVIWGNRKRIFPSLFPTDPSFAVNRTRSQSQTNPLTAEELAGTPPSSRRRAGTASNANAQGAAAVGADGRRRSRRRVRRTESGVSIRTLPEYSKEAGDEEMILVRQRSSSTIAEEFSDAEPLDEPTTARPLLPQDGDMADRSDEATSMSPVSLTAARPLDCTRITGADPTSDVEQPLQEVDLTDRPASQIDGPHSAPIANDHTPERVRTTSQGSRRGWGEAPTYLEAMSSPSFANSSTEAGVPPPRQRSIRERTSSSFRDLLSRAGFSSAGTAPSSYPSSRYPGLGQGSAEMTERRNGPNGAILPGSRHSSTSLLLQPQTSRLSTNTTLTAASITFPSHLGRQRSGSGSPSPYPSPWASSHSLVISPPVPNTAMRASFDEGRLPKAGLSDDQMRFLSSSEAVNMVGVKMGDVPKHKKNRRGSSAMAMRNDGSSSFGESTSRASLSDQEEFMGQQDQEGTTSTALPPSWHQVDEERRRKEAESRKGLSRPVNAVEGNSSTSAQGARDSDSGDAPSPTDPQDVTVEINTPDTPEQSSTVPSILLSGVTTPTPALEIEPPTPVTATPPPSTFGPPVALTTVTTK